MFWHFSVFAVSSVVKALYELRRVDERLPSDAPGY